MGVIGRGGPVGVIGSIQGTSLGTAIEYREVTIYSWCHSNQDGRNPMVPSAVALIISKPNN